MYSGRVLVVNNFDDRHVYVDVLRDHGHVVIEATTREQALRFLDEGEPPDVVVTDIVFDGSASGGASFIRELRARLESATSIIVLSGYVRSDDRSQARAVGADLFLMKPALPAAVRLEVERALILRRGGRRLSWNWGPTRPTAVIAPTEERRRA